MIGFPKHLNTRQDYENCHLLALSGEADKVEMRAAWQRLLDTARVWAFKAAVAAAYQPLANEKVMEERQADGTVKYACFELVDDPSAEINKLLFTVTTVKQKISELEVL